MGDILAITWRTTPLESHLVLKRGIVLRAVSFLLKEDWKKLSAFGF